MMGAINEFQILRLYVTPSETFITLSSRIRDSEFETTRTRRARSTPTLVGTPGANQNYELEVYHRF
jgi:hypothetical protein